MGVGGHCGSVFSPSGSPPDRRRNPRPDGGGKGLASRKIRRIMSALITMYTKTAGSVGAQTEQLSQIGWARGFSASTLTLISLCAPRLPTFRLQPLGYRSAVSKVSATPAFMLAGISILRLRLFHFRFYLLLNKTDLLP